ncbi:FtsQ-type POTRA domain-containing protein [Gordonia oryzae]|uniref:FtsQ-type POTRA domain-containing protein n=1 Tax=Gordonia oryzae TaxID=2487349 RepID=A0A3N4GXW4_9ACTN|nr:FtsQ-type POTRA domain-containing protein [Gordonia oryzae]RPA63460.1 FtsQ-type POTRA domain-containing protein [Gordonia oryzae]
MRVLPQRRRPRIVLGVVLTVVVVVGLVLIAYLTPLMSVRNIEISDNRTVPGAQILGAAAVASGTPLLQVDTEAVARRIAAIPSISSARVQRSYPSTLQITVSERVPVAVVPDGDKVHVLDRSGVGYLTYPNSAIPAEVKKLPVLQTATPGPADPTTRAALGVTAGLPPQLSALVLRVIANSPVDIELALTGDRKVIWGDDTRNDEKARTLGYLLSQRATEYNVSAPNFPAFR